MNEKYLKRAKQFFVEARAMAEYYERADPTNVADSVMLLLDGLENLLEAFKVEAKA